MRGEHWASVVSNHAGTWLIPACAGSTCPLSPTGRVVTAHPRMRGEHLVGHLVTGAVLGLIPACAGSTPGHSGMTCARAAHPRMRGEHSAPPFEFAANAGSSPHARGARGRFEDDVRRGGLIPACAGSTPTVAPMSTVRRAHPRMRGEHPIFFVDVSSPAGSSPHARGALRDLLGRPQRDRLIPACAGSTGGTTRSVTTPGAHPRMRGEHAALTSCSPFHPGSSPHARGARHKVRVDPAHHGLIPACAGSTTDNRSRTRTRWAHPRMRGEHVGVPTDICPAVGSSPHARGARHLPVW